MKKFWKIGIVAAALLGTVALTGAVSTGAASALTLQQGAEAARCDGCPEDLFGDDGVFKRITNIVLYVVGIISVIMLIVGGVKYLVSGGDSKKVTDAKNTVLYAIIGLVIVVLSFAIVNFVISALPQGSSNSTSTNAPTDPNTSAEAPADTPAE